MVGRKRYAVEVKLDAVTRGVQRRAVLPGFRRGHVPLDLVRQHFADRVEEEFLETYVPRLAGDAIEQSTNNA